jgi:hypothetical protein
MAKISPDVPEAQPGELAPFVTVNELEVRRDDVIGGNETFPKVAKMAGEFGTVPHQRKDRDEVTSIQATSLEVADEALHGRLT